MTDSGAASHDRPLCRCHGEPMTWSRDAKRKSGGFWRCTVKMRAYFRSPAGKAARDRFRATPKGREAQAQARDRYARTKRELVARIALKRARIEHLEALLHEAQDTR